MTHAQKPDLSVSGACCSLQTGMTLYRGHPCTSEHLSNYEKLEATMCYYATLANRALTRCFIMPKIERCHLPWAAASLPHSTLLRVHSGQFLHSLGQLFHTSPTRWVTMRRQHCERSDGVRSRFLASAAPPDLHSKSMAHTFYCRKSLPKVMIRTENRA